MCDCIFTIYGLAEVASWLTLFKRTYPPACIYSHKYTRMGLLAFEKKRWAAAKGIIFTAQSL